LTFFFKFSLTHLFELLLDLETVLSSRNDASLGDLLSIFMVKDHPHGVLEVFKLLRVDVIDLTVLNLAFFYEREQDIGCQGFDF
jgi:hypothetical protein